jgi:hypothetical protein
MPELYDFCVSQTAEMGIEMLTSFHTAREVLFPAVIAFTLTKNSIVTYTH